jgi:hypothetical protein
MNTYLEQKFNGKITMKQLFNPKIYLMVMFFCMTLTSNAVTKTEPKTLFGTYTIQVENHTTRGFYLTHKQLRFDDKKFSKTAYLPPSGVINGSGFYIHTELVNYNGKGKIEDHICIKDIHHLDRSMPNIVIRLKSKVNVLNYHYNKDITGVSTEAILKDFTNNYECFVEHNITNMTMRIYKDVRLDSKTKPNGDKRTSITLVCMISPEASKKDQIFLNSDIELRDMIFSEKYMLVVKPK